MNNEKKKNIIKATDEKSFYRKYGQYYFCMINKIQVKDAKDYF